LIFVGLTDLRLVEAWSAEDFIMYATFDFWASLPSAIRIP
jgi:hypothetical protein